MQLGQSGEHTFCRNAHRWISSKLLVTFTDSSFPTTCIPTRTLINCKNDTHSFTLLNHHILKPRSTVNQHKPPTNALQHNASHRLMITYNDHLLESIVTLKANTELTPVPLHGASSNTRSTDRSPNLWGSWRQHQQQ